uniref:ARAD1C26532p n=1 Tax=Blastobotrys adeninivorans TaxID=409370 RepID=A0A060T834_BLAAD
MVLTGRGGFGNYVKGKSNTVPSTPAPVQHVTSPKEHFRAGRGGYGNHVPIERMPTMTPQEYLQEVHEALDVEPPRYSLGRGGAGNIVKRGESRSPQSSRPRIERLFSTSGRRDSSLSTSSDSSSESRSLSAVFTAPARSTPGHSHDGLWSRLKTTISH